MNNKTGAYPGYLMPISKINRYKNNIKFQILYNDIRWLTKTADLRKNKKIFT